MEQKKKKIAIYGGSFDPIHMGHLTTARYVIENLHLDNLYLMPNATPPHKDHTAVSYADRVSLLECAIDDFKDPKIQISFIEEDPTVKHYTYNTLQNYCKEHPDEDVHFVMGMDSFLALNTWKRGLELTDFAHIVVLKRPQYQLENLPKVIKDEIAKAHPHNYIMLDSPNCALSSTEVRKAIKGYHQPPSAGFDFNELWHAYLQKALTKKTLEKIESLGLYVE